MRLCGTREKCHSERMWGILTYYYWQLRFLPSVEMTKIMIIPQSQWGEGTLILVNENHTQLVDHIMILLFEFSYLLRSMLNGLDNSLHPRLLFLDVSSSIHPYSIKQETPYFKWNIKTWTLIVQPIICWKELNGKEYTIDYFWISARRCSFLLLHPGSQRRWPCSPRSPR